MPEIQTVTLEVEIDREKLSNVIETEFNDVSSEEVSGTVQADLDEVIKEALTSVSLSSSNAPEPIGHAIEYAIIQQQ